jgi:hypothetical protein
MNTRSGASCSNAWRSTPVTTRRAGRGWPEDNRYWDSVYMGAAMLNARQDAPTLVEWRQELFFPG